MDLISSAIMAYLPSILLLVVGYALVVVEMYMPGFGVPGIIGGILLIAGVVLTKPTPLQALIMAVIIVILLCFTLSIVIHTASKGRMAKSKLVLHEVATRKNGADEPTEMSYFVGKTGVTTTVLRPAGMGEFDGVKLNVVSEGEFIASGEKVRIASVEGNRIVVEKA